MTCIDCEKPTTVPRSYPVVQYVDGSVGRVCVKCWVQYDYKAFMKPPE